MPAEGAFEDSDMDLRRFVVGMSRGASLGDAVYERRPPVRPKASSENEAGNSPGRRSGWRDGKGGQDEQDSYLHSSSVSVKRVRRRLGRISISPPIVTWIGSFSSPAFPPGIVPLSVPEV